MSFDATKKFDVHIFRQSTLSFDLQRRRVLFIYHNDGTKTAVNKIITGTNRKYAPVTKKGIFIG